MIWNVCTADSDSLEAIASKPLGLKLSRVTDMPIKQVSPRHFNVCSAAPKKNSLDSGVLL